MGVVLQMIQQNHEQSEAGHARLRGDWREHEARLSSLEATINGHALKFERMETAAKAPVDILRIGLSLKLALAIAGAVLSMGAAAWSSAAWVKSDVKDLRTDLNTQQAINKEWHDAIVKSIDELRKRQELTELEVRNQKRGR